MRRFGDRAHRLSRLRILTRERKSLMSWSGLTAKSAKQREGNANARARCGAARGWSKKIVRFRYKICRFGFDIIHMASRHLTRSIVMQSLFEWDFSGCRGRPSGRSWSETWVNSARDCRNTVLPPNLQEGWWKTCRQSTRIISKAAPQWPIDQISIVDRNILRLGLYELLYEDKDAVRQRLPSTRPIELAKNFGGEKLGKVYQWRAGNNL